MNIKNTLLFTVATIFMISCTKTEKPTEVLKYVEEPHSYAQPNEAVITHLDLDIDVNFDKMKPRGRSFTSESNPQHVRWLCVECHMESSISGILRHHRYSGHVGKQRQDVIQ